VLEPSSMTDAPLAAAPPSGAMPLTAHLAELRGRIIWSILAIVVGGTLGFAWGPAIIELLKSPLPSDVELIQIELGDGFAIRIQIALVVGVILAMPVLLWHLWRFVAPGLTLAERTSISRCCCRPKASGS